MKIVATCANCAKPFKSVHLALPAEIPGLPHTVIPTLNNCRSCGGRGVHVSEVREASQHDR